MGFYRLDGIIEAQRQGRLRNVLAGMNKNDLAILKRELQGYAARKRIIEEMTGMIQTVDTFLKRAAH